MYKLSNISYANLINKGFKDVGEGQFLLRFPIYFYGSTPLIFCNATVIPEEGKKVNIDVVRKDGVVHLQWFEKNYAQAKPLLNILDKNIDNKMRKIGAKKYEDK